MNRGRREAAECRRNSVPKPPHSHRPPQRRRESRLPLDPSHLTQRELSPDGQSPLATVRLKSPTRNPTIFRKRIADTGISARHGDIVRVLGKDDSVVGHGLWNPRAEAVVRLLRWGEIPPDDAWWLNRFDEAIELRRGLLDLDRTTSAYRVINADGDGLPGLVADRYADVLSLEVFSLGMFQRAEAIARSLSGKLGTPHWIVRPGPQTLEQEGFLADGFESGKTPEKVRIREHGLDYEVLPFAGHKTGFFCDQRENRLRLRQFCSGKSVLDLCCYTGGFALNAAAAGAEAVTAVDLDEEAIKHARRNAQLNKAGIKFVHADAFAYMRDMQRNGKQFGVVVLDPPKLIHSREEQAEGQQKYFDLNRLAASLLAPGGILLTCSCSGLFGVDEFTRTVRAATSDRQPRLLLRTGAGPDHPVSLGSLEGEYLKCLWLQAQA